MSAMTIETVAKAFTAEIAPPGSKSLTNRALVLAAMAEGQSELSNCLFADDTHVMIESLGRLGFGVEVDRGTNTILMRGGGGKIPVDYAELFCGNSGTSIRFLTALCSLGKGRYVLDGIPRMRQRPIGQLVDLLRNLGVRIEYVMEEGFPPVRVLADGLVGGIGRFGEAQSSQFLSAVVMACPYARHEVKIDLEGEQTSWPYVTMTMQLMDHFGAMVELYRDPMTGEPRQIIVPRAKYQGTAYAVEPDASNASYFLAAAALHEGSKVTIRGLGKRSLQGDVGFADVLHRMGAGLIFGPDFITVMGTDVLEGIDVDLRDMPDMAQTLAVVALFAKGETRIRGLHTLRLKETDRIAALAKELGKFGAEVEVEESDLVIVPPNKARAAAVDTYDDHRMAMSFALAGTKVAGVVIREAECVNKTYPGYFGDLKRVVGGG
jgi:3-phosphoshikimate 1-carboxyvinyltransferase